MEPINQEDDLYRQFNCGWLCLQVPPTMTVTVLWSSIISHFVRTDLTLAIKGDLVTHVYPVPKGSMLRNIHDVPHLMLYDRYSARLIPECQHCPITRMFRIGVMNKTPTVKCISSFRRSINGATIVIYFFQAALSYTE